MSMSRLAIGVLILAGALGARVHDGTARRNAEIARERMGIISQAYFLYLNNNSPPPGLSWLYPEYVSDPLTFWHPGDSDPPPTTIDNDVPNAPNSSRISFELDFGDQPNCVLFFDALGMRDNSAENNAGRFIMRYDGDWTEPPLVLPTPTPQTHVRRSLHQIGVALAIYANFNLDTLPPNLKYVWDDCYVRSAPAFWNPGDSDPAPTEITNAEPDAPQSAHISFEFPAANQVYSLVQDDVLVRDSAPENNGGFGVFELNGRRELSFRATCPGDVTGDRRVRRRDVKVVLRNLGMTQHATFRDGDANGDGSVDEDDLAIVLKNLGNRCD